MGELTKRQQLILKIIVREYVRNGQPVGSKALVEKYRLGISSATVRNEMAILEGNGYLRQPHTSAGRVPTETGYRYFVEKLMEEPELAPNEQLMIQHQFHQARLELDQWMRLGAAVLAHTTGNASWVTSPKVTQCRLKHIELISIHDHVVLLVLVLKEGTVKQQILNLEQPHSQEELRSISHHLTDLWQDGSIRKIMATQAGLSELSHQVAEVVLETMNRLNARTSSDMYHDGLLHILQDTALSEQDVLEQVIRALEEPRLVEQLAGHAIQESGVQIIIAGEGKWEDLSHISVVLSSYGIEDGAAGVLGVIGPTRMRYARAVSTVRYMASLMSSLIGDLYGPNQ